MAKYNVLIVGAGNISNTRHIPAVKKVKDSEIKGIIGIHEKNVNNSSEKIKVQNKLVLNKDEEYYSQLENLQWVKDSNAVIIGTPPKDHYELVKTFLNLGKNVLVEKPMTMDTDEADELIKLSKEKDRKLAVMHNFQYASGILKMEKLIKNNELGEIKSFCEFQFTNRNRRLPLWYDDLPLGLYYDEAAHFIYLLEKFGGQIIVENAYAKHTNNQNTPSLINANMTAGGIPVELFINFDSPVCEWVLMVCGSEKIAIYDFFKDILFVLPTDNEHYAKDILNNSLRSTFQHWWGFIKNGVKMITGNLLYGQDVVVKNFLSSIDESDESNGNVQKNVLDSNIDAEKGYITVKYMNDIIDAVNFNSSTNSSINSNNNSNNSSNNNNFNNIDG